MGMLLLCRADALLKCEQLGSTTDDFVSAGSFEMAFQYIALSAKSTHSTDAVVRMGAADEGMPLRKIPSTNIGDTTLSIALEQPR